MPAPDFATFSAALAEGKGQVLWRELVADLETPVGAYLKLANGRPNSFLLESVEGGSARGRYSAIGLDPDLIFLADTICCGESAETVAARPGWDAITAVQNGNVIPMSDDLASRWGPRVVEYLAAASAAVNQAAVPA